jgi:hypothetical protein
VPVARTSPGSKVTTALASAIKSQIPHTMSEVLESCFTTPLTLSLRERF